MAETGQENALAAAERLAEQVRNELTAAGLPVASPDVAPGLALGALVRVDASDHHFHGHDVEVVVSWEVSSRLRSNAMEDVRQRRGLTPAIRQSGETRIAMGAAVIAILSAAGFTARDRNDDMSPFDVLVLAGPEPGRRPAWALPDEALDPPASAAN